MSEPNQDTAAADSVKTHAVLLEPSTDQWGVYRLEPDGGATHISDHGTKREAEESLARLCPVNPWTPEPWRQNGVFACDQDDVCLAVCGTFENAERIVACVNGCAGLNPEAVSGLLDETKRLNRLLHQIIYPVSSRHENPVGAPNPELGRAIATQLENVEAVISRAERREP